MEHDDRARFREIYLNKIRPYLADGDRPSAERGSSERTHEVFGALRNLVAAPARAALDDLENIFEEEQQLSRQIRLHRWLHAWLLVHVPLSVVLLLLATVHAIVALRY